MHDNRQSWPWVGVVLGLLVMLTGCASTAKVRQLSPAEQAEFQIYRKVMTPVQTRTYLAKAAAAERTAYLEEIGLAQRFQALDPHDREAVQYGFLREGMSADALRFLWGEPARVQGDARRSAHWYYVGAFHALGLYGNQLSLSRLHHRLPRGQAHPEVVQGTAEFHHQIADAFFPQAEAIFHDTTALDTTGARLDP